MKNWWLSIKKINIFIFTTAPALRAAVVFMLLLCQKSISAQKEGDNWVMSQFPTVKLSFTGSSFSVDTNFEVHPFFTFMNTSSSVSDSSGKLLFFTNGVKVFNRTGKVMPNGDSLSFSYYTHIGWGGITNNNLQGALTLKKPESDSLFYIFHFTANDSCPPPVNNTPGWQPCSLMYSIVDITKNNGLGDVVSKDNIFFQGANLATGQFSACRHANGKDWWLVKNAYLENIYYKFLFTGDGILGPYIQQIGNSFNEDEVYGSSLFSNNGDRFASGTGFSKVAVMNFNRCSGVFSDPDSLSPVSSCLKPGVNFAGAGLAFSPSGDYLYVNAISDLYQYESRSANMQQTEVKLFEITVDTPNVTNWHFLPMQLAPNGKIYLGPYNPNRLLSVIEQPDSAGLGCNFKPYSFQLPSYFNDPYGNSGRGMPNMPNFRLGASPVYQMQAGANRTICKDSTTQLGSAQKVNELIYNWRSTDPVAYISDVHSHSPTVSTTADEVLFIVDVVDTVSRLTCLERSDTVVVKTYTCYPNQLNIPTIIKSGSHPYLVIPNLAVGTQVSVYNVAGQLMYQSADYQNNWDARIVANGVYVVTTRMGNGHRQNGKVVVVE